MEPDEFWDLIERSRIDVNGCEDQAEKLTQLLVKYTPDEVLEFEKRFWFYLKEAYRWDLLGVAYLINGGCSDDAFQYFCCWLIGQGRTVYEGALLSPETIGDYVSGEEGEVGCEDLLGSAAHAFEKLTGDFPFTSLDMPSALSGEKWREEDLEDLFPTLSSKLH